MANNTPVLLTLKQVAEHFQVSQRTIHRYIKDGTLNGLFSGQWRFTEEDIALCEKNMRKIASARKTK